MGSKTDGLIEDLKRFRRKLQKRYAIERMILFGSRARGQSKRFSDVDLIVVSKKFNRKGAIERAAPLHLEWDLGLPVDFLCYTPEEFRILSARGGLVKEALREGIPISG
jgi:predicted nucleotidyltransferase